MIVLPNILINRWNAKRIATRVKASRKEDSERFILEEDELSIDNDLIREVIEAVESIKREKVKY